MLGPLRLLLLLSYRMPRCQRPSPMVAEGVVMHLFLVFPTAPRKTESALSQKSMELAMRHITNGRALASPAILHQETTYVLQQFEVGEPDQH